MAEPSVLESVAQSRRILNAIIERACPVHDAPAGQSCWTIEPDRTGYRVHAAVCNERIERWRRLQRSARGQGPTAHRAGYLDPARLLLDRRHPNRNQIPHVKEAKR